MRPAAPDLSLVPPHRLGDLLSAHRLSRGIPVADLAGPRSGFEIADLREIEQGLRLLDDRELVAITQLYGLAPSQLVPDRAVLVLDRVGGELRAGDLRRPLPPDASVDQILERYVALLHLLRGIDRARAELPALRRADMDVLASGLDRTITEIEQRLGVLLTRGPAGGLVERLRHRLAVPAAGVLVGLSAVGALVLAPLPEGARPRFASSDGILGAPVTLIAVRGGTTAEAALTSSSYDPTDPVSVGAVAEGYLSYPWQEVLGGWSIHYEAPRPGFRGTTDPGERRIVVHVTAGDTPYAVAEVLAHEIGHAVDVSYLIAADRDRWAEQRGLTGPWWPASEEADFSVGAGDFAEAVAAVLVGSPSDATHGPFSPADLDLAAELLTRAARSG